MKYRAVAVSVCIIVGGCGLDDRIEGCGSEADALASYGLKPSSSSTVEIAGIPIPLPTGYMFRRSDDVLELLVAPGIYCDSGDWGVYQGGFMQLQIHDGIAPTDAFLRFPNTHRGHAREQINMALGAFDYTFQQNSLEWHVRAYLSDTHHPRVIFMYLRTEFRFGEEEKALAIHYFPSRQSRATPPESGLRELTADFESTLRKRVEADD